MEIFFMKSKIISNPYRLLGVYANASLKDIKSNFSKIKAFLSVKKTPLFECDFNEFLPPVERNIDDLKSAESFLLNVSNRVLSALTWFCKTNGTDTQGLDLLRTGNLKKAKSQFLKTKNTDISNRVNAALCAYLLGEDSEYFNLINKISNDVELLTAFKNMLFDGTQAEISASDFKKIIDRFVSENGSIDYSVKTATQGSSVKPIDRNILQKLETGLLEIQNDFGIVRDKGQYGMSMKTLSGFMDDFDSFCSSFSTLQNSSEFKESSFYQKLCNFSLQVIVECFDNLMLGGRWLQHPAYLENVLHKFKTIFDFLDLKNKDERESVDVMMADLEFELKFAKEFNLTELEYKIFPAANRKSLQDLTNNLYKIKDKVVKYVNKPNPIQKIFSDHLGVYFNEPLLRIVSGNLENCLIAYSDILDSDISEGAKKLLTNVLSKNIRIYVSAICGAGPNEKFSNILNDFIFDNKDVIDLLIFCSRFDAKFKQSGYVNCFEHVKWLFAIALVIDRILVVKKPGIPLSCRELIKKYFNKFDEFDIRFIECLCSLLKPDETFISNEIVVARYAFYLIIGEPGISFNYLLISQFLMVILRLITKYHVKAFPSYITEYFDACDHEGVKDFFKNAMNYDSVSSIKKKEMELNCTYNYKKELQRLKHIMKSETGSYFENDDTDDNSESYYELDDSFEDDDDFDDSDYYFKDMPVFTDNSAPCNNKKHNVRKKLTKKQKQQKRKARRNNRR